MQQRKLKSILKSKIKKSEKCLIDEKLQKNRLLLEKTHNYKSEMEHDACRRRFNRFY